MDDASPGSEASAVEPERPGEAGGRIAQEISAIARDWLGGQKTADRRRGDSDREPNGALRPGTPRAVAEEAG